MKRKKPVRRETDRTRMLLYVLLACFAAVALRLAYLQILSHDFFRDMSSDQTTRVVELFPDRGDIFDRNGNLLATSLQRWSVYVRPRAIKNKRAVIDSLILISRSDEKLIREKFIRGSNFWLKRKADRSLAQKVLSLECTGIDVIPEKKRIYPKGRLAAQLIGFAGMDNQGLSGIELGFNDYLTGVPGKYVFERDLRGREIATAKAKEIQAPSEGMNVYLTIDESIQYIAQKELNETARATGARAGTITVVDIRNGDILAIAGYPDFDPNFYSKALPYSWKLGAVTDQYEPGSTFKVITASAGIAEGLFGPDSIIPVPDSLKFGGITVHNSHAVVRDKPFKNLKDVIAESLNTGTAYIGIKLGAGRFYRHIKDFGFGSRTGIEFPGEARGMVQEPHNWYKSDVATYTYGQSLSVTPLQLVMAYAAIANNGMRMVPRIVDRIESPDRDIVRAESPRQAGRALAESVIGKVKEVMKAAVYQKHGSGHRAKMLQFTVAGKTGTAQKPLRGGYSPNKYISSFAGFAPASKPRIAMMITLDEPKSSIWGETTAAPVFSRVGEFALRYLNVPPDM